MDAFLPDYGRACVSRIVPALTGRVDAGFLPDPARDADSVVVLVLDGLGWQAVRDHADRVPTLASMAGGPITTVAPSTTATALTSLTTGLTPAVHGLVGFRMRLDDRILNVLRWQASDGRRPPAPTTVQRREAFGGREVPAVTRSEFRSTGFTEAHLRGMPFRGWTTTPVLVEWCRRLVAQGEPLVYAYYPGVDTVAHEFGIRDTWYLRELEFADRLVGELLAALPPRASLCVTADHGQAHIPPGGWVKLGELDSIVRAMAGDGRFRYLYATPGEGAALLRAAQDAHGGHAWVFSRDQLLDEGWLGPERASSAVRRRLGDVVLAARDDVGFVDPAMPAEARLVGAHGSLTRNEMEVPLLASYGRA